MPTENVKVQFHSSHGNGRVPQAISKLTYHQRSPLCGVGGSRCGSSVDGHARPGERPTRLYGRRLIPPPRRRCPRRSSRTQARPDCARHGRRLSRAWIRIRRGLLYMISRTSGPPSAMPGSSGGCSRSRSADHADSLIEESMRRWEQPPDDAEGRLRDPGPEMPRNCWSDVGYRWEISRVRLYFDSLLSCALRVRLSFLG